MGAYSDYIAQIGREIEQEIESEHFAAEIPEFPGVPFHLPEEFLGGTADLPSTENLQESILYTQSLKERQVLFYRDLTSHYKGVHGIVVLGKRVIRKLVRFLLEPLIREINQNRIAAAFALEGINRHLMLQRGYEELVMEEIRSVKRENQLLREKLDRLEKLAKEE